MRFDPQTLASLVGKDMTVRDARTGVIYTQRVHDVTYRIGGVSIQLAGSNVWFTPTAGEVETVLGKTERKDVTAI